jgi:hypothetical protein
MTPDELLTELLHEAKKLGFDPARMLRVEISCAPPGKRFKIYFRGFRYGGFLYERPWKTITPTQRQNYRAAMGHVFREFKAGWYVTNA